MMIFLHLLFAPHLRHSSHGPWEVLHTPFLLHLINLVPWRRFSFEHSTFDNSPHRIWVNSNLICSWRLGLNEERRPWSCGVRFDWCKFWRLDMGYGWMVNFLKGRNSEENLGWSGSDTTVRKYRKIYERLKLFDGMDTLYCNAWFFCLLTNKPSLRVFIAIHLLNGWWRLIWFYGYY